jgi:hypothetical protein
MLAGLLLHVQAELRRHASSCHAPPPWAAVGVKFWGSSHLTWPTSLKNTNFVHKQSNVHDLPGRASLATTCQVIARFKHLIQESPSCLQSYLLRNTATSVCSASISLLDACKEGHDSVDC